MSDLNTEIKLSANADGVETGVARAKRSLADLSATATQTGEKGGQGLGKLGAGGEDAARKVDAATRSMQNSLQRQIAALEAGGTATRQYQESLAKLRGIDANTLKPLLDQLDAAKAKADRASHSMGGMGDASSMLKSNLAALAGSLTLGSMAAFVVRINDGVDALNDIKDATGSTIENISALEDVGKRTGASLDLVGGVLIKFNQVLGNATPKSDIAMQLHAIGLSAEELKRIDPAEALLRTAQALDKYADDGTKARLVQDLFGKSVKEAAPFLKDLAEKGELVAKVTTQQADEAERFNKELFAMQANIQEASRRLAGPFVSAVNEVAQAFRNGSAAGKGFWETAWERYKSNVAGLYKGNLLAGSTAAADAAAGSVGSGDTALARAQAGAGDDKPAIVLGPTAAERAAAEAAAKAAATARAHELKEQQKFYADMAGLAGDYYDKLARAQKELAAGNITEAQYADYIEKLIEKQPFATAATKANADALKLQAQAAAAANEAFDAYFDVQEKARLNNEAQIKTGREMLAQIQFEASLLGMTAEQRALATAARELERQGIVKGTQAWDAYADAISRATLDREAKREALDFWGSIESTAKGVWTDVGRQGVSAFERVGDTIRSAVLDMLWQVTAKKWLIDIGVSMGVPGAALAAQQAGMGTNALGLASNMGSLYNAGSTVAGWLGLGAATGTGIAAAAGTGLSLASAGTGLGLSASAGTGLGLASTAGTGLGLTGTAASGASLGSGLAAGSAAASGSAMSSIMAAAPWLLGGVAVLSLLKSLDDSGTYHTGGLGSYSAAGGTAVGDAVKNQGLGFDLAAKDYTASSQQAAAALAQSVVGMLDSTANTFGQQAGYYAATAFADDTSKDGAWGQLMLKLGDQVLIDWKNGTDKWPGREFADGETGAKEYAAAVAKDVRDYLVTQTPDWADAALNALGDAPTLENLAATVTQINATEAALQGMGRASSAFADMGDEVSSRLIAALGGAEAAAARMGSYYSNFYSDAERQAITRKRLTDAAATAGITDLPTDRAGYRALVDRTQASGNTALAAALITYSDAFASTTDTIGTSAETLAATVSQATPQLSAFDKAVADLGASSKSAAIDLMRALGDDAGARAAERADYLAGLDTMSDAERDRLGSLYDQNQAIRDQISAIEKQRTASAELRSLIDSAYGSVDRFASSGNARAFKFATLGAKAQEALGGSAADWTASFSAATPEQIKAAVSAFFELPDASTAAKAAVLGLGNQLLDLSDAADQSAKQLAQSAMATYRAGLTGIIDAAAANTDATSAAFERGIASQRKLAETSKTAAEKLKTEVQGIFDSLQSSVDSLFASTDSTKQYQAAQGQQYIAAALAAARATGALPDGKELSRAITAATGGLDAANYRTQAEADYAKLVLANELRDLQTISGDQLTEAERQVQAAEAMLIALDDAAQYARDQLNEARGIKSDTATMAQLLAAIAAESTTRQNVAASALLGTGQSVYGLATQTGANATGQVFSRADAFAAAAPFATGDARDALALYSAAQQSGFSLGQLEKIYGMGTGTLDAEVRKIEEALGLTLPRFADGGWHSGGWAMVGERGPELAYMPPAQIYTAPQTASMLAGGNNAELIAEVRLLRTEVATLKDAIDTGSGHAKRTADGIEAVKRGNALITKTAEAF